MMNLKSEKHFFSPHPDWQKELQFSYTTAQDLVALGLIREQEEKQYQKILEKYSFHLTRYYANLISKEDPECPIRRQAVPSLEEGIEMGKENSRWSFDPLQDLTHQPVSRITHRYANRALLHLTPVCSMYCRFCFRKTLLNEKKKDLFEGGLEPAFQYLSEHTEIEEVILSGGDPLMSSDVVLDRVREKLEGFPHIQRLRIHSRVPVTFPQRITSSLLSTLETHRLQLILVSHFNHPKEMTQEVKEKFEMLRAMRKIYLLNQTVLLKGVNNKALILKELSHLIFDFGMLPYYLHHPDKAVGTAHFDLSLEEGMGIYRELKKDLPGYLVPRYVVDRVDVPYKTSGEEALYFFVDNN